MLFSMPTRLPVELMGPTLQGPTEVEKIKALQKALKDLSVAAQRPDIDPGAIDGVVNAQTTQAIIAGSTLITAELPSWAFVALQAALSVGAMTSQAKAAITAAAVPLTTAANTAAVKFNKVTPSGGGSSIVGFFAPGWHKTPLGIGLIIAAGLIGWKLFFSSPTPTRAA